MTHLLDTDTCIHLLRGTSSVIAQAERQSPEDLAVSVVTQFELLCGVERCSAKWRKRETAKVRLFFASVPVLAFTGAMATLAAQSRAALEEAGNPIGPMDLLIAATALDQDLVLVTGNLHEFNRVPGLSCVSWTA